jgi:site-specific DNA-methyltransferase (adenine-specific)
MTLELHHGDCLEVMRDLSDASVDLFLCDLPYGCLSIQGKPKISEEKAKQIWGKWSEKNLQSYGNGCAWDIKLDLEAFWKQIKRLRRSDTTPCIMFCTTKFGYELIKSNEKEFRYDLVWDKQRGVSFLSANKMPMRSHEMIYVFSKSGAYYKRIDISGNFEPYAFKATDTPATFIGTARTATQNDGSTRCALSVIKTPNKTLRKSAHPTEKPSELYKWLIERYCPEGGVVLDPTAGSFNSVFTAFALDRSAIGIEKDETFYKRGVERLGAL